MQGLSQLNQYIPFRERAFWRTPHACVPVGRGQAAQIVLLLLIAAILLFLCVFTVTRLLPGQDNTPTSTALSYAIWDGGYGSASGGGSAGGH